MALLKTLIAQADIVIEKFRPGVMDKIGLGFEVVKTFNPPPGVRIGNGLGHARAVGQKGQPGSANSGHVRVDLAKWRSRLAAHAFRAVGHGFPCRRATGGVDLGLFNPPRQDTAGGRVEIILMESLLSLQFEVLTTWLNDGHQPPRRCAKNNAHAWLSAPYGIYQTADGYLALAMGSLADLAAVFGSDKLAAYREPASGFRCRDAIKAIITECLLQNLTGHWLTLLWQRGFWAAEVYDWKTLYATARAFARWK